jgi:hypothetical protein
VGKVNDAVFVGGRNCVVLLEVPQYALTRPFHKSEVRVPRAGGLVTVASHRAYFAFTTHRISDTTWTI